MHTLPDERKETLEELATVNSPAKVQVNMSKSNFESHFLSANHAAYAWQYEVPDSDHDEENALLELLKIFRAISKNAL